MSHLLTPVTHAIGQKEKLKLIESVSSRVFLAQKNKKYGASKTLSRVRFYLFLTPFSILFSKPSWKKLLTLLKDCIS
jgi:hypothetical protein